MDAAINRGSGGDSGGVFCLQCNCSCPCCGPGSRPSSALPRALKRKLEKMEEDARRWHAADVARVEINIEAAALREALGSQQQSIQELYSEIDEERAAASTAASEAMSMILRLQREKAEAEMDARQFKRLAEEKMSHDQHEIELLEDLLYKRDEAVQSLSCEVQAYRHRLLSYGIDPVPTEPNSPTAFPPTTTPTAGGYETYPPPCCELDDFPVKAGNPDLKYATGDTPRGHLQRTPSIIMEKGVNGNDHSLRWAKRSLRRHSTDGYVPPSFRQDLGNNEFQSVVDPAYDTYADGKDDMSDRVYTIDAVHGQDHGDTNMNTPRDFPRKRELSSGNVDEGEVRRLYMRLQALEADRESMRQSILTNETGKAQMLLLKEIAQQLCKGPAPETRIVQKASFIRRFSVISAFKWVASLFFWWKKSPSIKYPFGPSNRKPGLSILLDKSPRKRLKRCLTRPPR